MQQAANPNKSLLNNLTLRDCILFCILLFCCFRLPLEAEIKGHDLSAEAGLEYWSMNKYQYGTQIMPNTGPLGFINYPDVYTGFLTPEKMVIQFALLCIFTALLMHLAKKIPDQFSRRLLLFNVAVFAYITYVPFRAGKLDTSFYLFMLFIGYSLLHSRSWLTLGWFALLALFSLTKGTLMMISLCIIGVSIVFYLTSRRYMHALLAPVIYGAAFVTLWVLCGQNIDNLPHYMDKMIGIREGYAAGYNEAMALFEDPLMTFLGVTLFVCSTGVIAIRNLRGGAFSSLRLFIQCGCCMAIELLILFVVWKHSYVRTGENLGYFFRYCLVAFPLFFWMPSLQPKETHNIAAKAKLFRELSAIYYISTFICIAVMIVYAKVITIPPAIFNAYALLNPHTATQKVQEAMGMTKIRNALPNTKKLVGDAPMGHFGNELTLLLYNGFNYSPMPRIVPFTAWNHATMEMDAAFYRNNETAPPYILYKQETIDEKLMGQEGALAQLEIFSAYEPVQDKAIRAETKDYMLLKRQETKDKIAIENIVPARQASLGDWITVPKNSLPVRLKLRIEPTLSAKLIGFLYKRPEYLIQIKLNNGKSEIKRIIPISMREGVLVAPYLRNNTDIRNAFDKDEYEVFMAEQPSSLQKITEFRIGCRYMEFACSDNFDVEFETVSGLGFGRIHKD